jgi:hypothetical protein
VSTWQAALLAYVLLSALSVWALCRVVAFNAGEERAPKPAGRGVPKKSAN